ncbi:MAG: hypothetical protein HY815_11535 [Candidatus Riflebacteria bacterium]|nr:hypothetical protein [Candidatus Riflebacteria bacterium]
MRASRSNWFCFVWIAAVLVGSVPSIATGGTLVVVPDFTENSTALGLGGPAADVLARALQKNQGLTVVRTAGPTLPPGSVRVEGEIDDVGVTDDGSRDQGGAGYGRPLLPTYSLGHRLDFGPITYTLSLSGRVRVVDCASGKVIAVMPLAGDALTVDSQLAPYTPTGSEDRWSALWLEVLDSALTDRQTGVVKTVELALR